MRPRLIRVALGAALLAWSGASSRISAQDHPTGHDEKKHTTDATDDQALEKLMAGLSDAEKKQLRAHVAQIPAEHRKMMTDHMMSLSPEERRKMIQQVLNGGAGGSAHGMHGHGSVAGHARHGAGHSGHGASGEKPAPGALAIGDKVPDFAMRDLQGKTYRLSDLRKQTKSGVVSLTFWCSFCHSCRDVEARLDRFARDQRGKAVVAAIDASAGETAAGISAFAKKKSLTLPILIDAPGKAADLFGVKVTTTTVVIDRDGKLRYRGQFIDGDKLFAGDALKAVLAGKLVAHQETALRG